MKKFQKIPKRITITRRVTISPTTDGDLKVTTSTNITKVEVIKKR